MNKKKKIILSFVIVIIVVGAAFLTVTLLKKKTRSNRTASVYPVESLGYSSYDIGTSDTLSGYVAVDKEQKIYLTSTDQISEVKVSEGDTVKAGDVLIVYDTTSQQLELESMEADVSVAQAEVLAAQRDLKILQNTTPVEETTEETTEEITTEEPSTEDTSTDEEDTTEETSTEEPTTEEPTTEEPTTEAPSTDDDTTDNSEQASILPNDVYMLGDAETDGDEGENDEPEVTYTKEELDKAIQDKQNEIKQLNIEYQIKLVELELMEYQAATGEVVCNFDGVVKTVADRETAILNNEPFIVVSGTDSCTVSSYIGELSLGTVGVGDMVSMYSYENGMTYTGVIAEISDVPTDDYYSYDGTAETYYSMTISVEDGGDLTQDMYMEVTLLSDGDSSDSIYLPMALVGKEDGAYYVMKEVDGRLEKVYVETGKIIWGGEEIEIISGVSYEDYLAIPYSEDAITGVKTVEKTSDDAYGY